MKYPTKKIRGRKYLLLIPLFATAAVVYIFGYYEETKRKMDPEIEMIDNLIVPGFLVHTEGCRIPYMNPFDLSVKKYLAKSSHFNCSNKPTLIESNQTSIYVMTSALEAYNLTSELDLNCCYSPFWRKEVKSGTVDNGADNKIEYSSTCTSFVKSANIYDEYVRVTCKINGVETYQDFHAFIIPKKIPSSDNDTPKSQGPSVLILGIDSVSRLNFYRHMPKTRKILNDLKAIKFVGYNKVADNTFSNLVPLFSGYSVEEIEKFCWLDSNNVFDDCPWIWKYYNTFGYNTAYGEDACWMGVFNYLKNGFSQPPVDYYLRTYMKANEDEIGHSKLLNAKYCVGPRFATQILFKYAYKFCSNFTLSNKKFWGFYWGRSLTQNLNIIPNADDIYETFLKNIQKDGILDNTVIFFMSDHGVKWGGIRQAFESRIEERLPFLYILLPKWIRESYKSAVMNMLRNKNMLTTPFDVYETMKDLLDLDLLKEEFLIKRAKELKGERGISLFLEIPEERTCESAGIKEEWCACH